MSAPRSFDEIAAAFASSDSESDTWSMTTNSDRHSRPLFSPQESKKKYFFLIFFNLLFEKLDFFHFFKEVIAHNDSKNKAYQLVLKIHHFSKPMRHHKRSYRALMEGHHRFFNE